MQGVIFIERESTDGDRGMVEMIDVEGLPVGTDALELAKQRCRVVLANPTVFAVRAIHEHIDGLTVIWKEQA